MSRFLLPALLAVCALAPGARGQSENPKSESENPSALFARENLVAWCIVPFDGKKRSPAERAAMVARLGFPAVAYDWRAPHVAEFEREILEYQKHGLRYAAFWDWHEEAVALFEKHRLAPQFWFSVPNTPADAARPEAERVRLAAEKILPRVRRAAQLSSQIGLYNHGGWSGEPATMVAVARELRERHGATNVGIVYNLHHGHDQVDRFAEHLALMKPHLLCLNLNGMTRDGDRLGKKLLPLGRGELDLALLRTIRDSGYRGPIGLIGHTQDDVEDRLRDNLDGLAWLVAQLDSAPAGPQPVLRTPPAGTGAPKAAAPKTSPVSPPAPPRE